MDTDSVADETQSPSSYSAASASMWAIGHHMPAEGAIDAMVVDKELADGYDMITSEITNTVFRTRIQSLHAQARAEGKTTVHVDALTADEVAIQPAQYMNVVVVCTSSWIAVDSPDFLFANISKQVLALELSYAAFCGASSAIVHGPTSSQGTSLAEFSNVIDAALSANMYMQLFLHLPVAPSEIEKSPYDALSSWDVWNTIRTICKYSVNLSIALELPAKLPKDESVTKRWFAEPIRIVLLPSSVFRLNNSGYPVLPKSHQAVIARYMKLRPTPFIILSDTQQEPPSTGNTALRKRVLHEPDSYRIYLRNFEKTRGALSQVERFGSGYQDYLQVPLQPLTDNLESITYEVFEKDPVKYDQYEKAIKLALEDRAADKVITVAVVGAGRGPLVTRALKAASASGRTISMHALEKNPNAYVHLLRKNTEEWDSLVTITKSDMRGWNPPFKVDIMISELLGSFGDNELSPECLDGVQKVLEPINGVMIPQSYSAHYTPIMSSKLHSAVSARRNEPDAFETPYVVMLHSVEILAENDYIHRAWDFHHPVAPTVLANSAAIGGGTVGLGEGGNEHNLRNSSATFRIPRRGVIHGLAGYFESVLYGNVELSTRPDTIDFKSKDMISWFPIFFPLKTPLYVPDNSEVDVSFWRQTSERKVWYEWVVEGFFWAGATELLQRFRLGSLEVHSSKKNGCLM